MRERTRVSLWLRIKTKSGNGTFCPAVLKKNLYGLIDEKATYFPRGVYYLRYSVNGRRTWERIGGDVFSAENKRKIREGELGLNTFAPAPKAPVKPTLAEQRERFLELKRLTKKTDGTKLDKETLSAYEQQTKEFLTVAAKKTYAEEIDGMDLRRYMAALEARGVTHRTICNNYTSIATFLKFCGVDHKELLPQGERPRPDDGTPEAYTYDEVVRFLAAITRERDRLAFEFLLKTGAREREMTHACWTDIPGGEHPVWKIQNHPELKFRTKTGKSRVVPLEKGLYDRLMMWREKNHGTKLIFGTSGDKPDTHFLEVCKETAKRAGLTGNWYLHKWRATFATWALRAGTDIRTVQDWMGHSSISMTERYLEPGTGRAVQEKVNAAFGISLDLAVAENAAVM